MSDKKEMVRHPSFATIGISRVSIGEGVMSLFDSPLRHHHAIKVFITHAAKVRNLSQDWVHAEEEIVEVYMSEVQFANFVTSAGIAGGTPCTLNRLQGKSIQQCPEEHTRESFENDVKDDLKELKGALAELNKLVEDIAAKPRLTADDKAKPREAAHTAYSKVSDSLPFVHQQFTEAMDKTVSTAKAEIGAHVQHVIKQAGLEKIADAGEFPRLEQK